MKFLATLFSSHIFYTNFNSRCHFLGVEFRELIPQCTHTLQQKATLLMSYSQDFWFRLCIAGQSISNKEFYIF